MERILPLTPAQQDMAEKALPLVKRVIYKYVSVNDTVPGLDFDELFGEGCVWLCKAAASFRPDKGAKFETYAERVVANGLRTYCRLTYRKQKHCILLSDCEEFLRDVPAEEEPFEEHLTEQEILQFLQGLKSEYSGVARLGIEAIEWKVKGLSGAEIARMYRVKPNAVGAWISRAVQKLRKNRVFTLWIEQFTGGKPA